MIKVVKNKNLIEEVFNYEVILFSMGINNAMNKGFSYEVGLNFKEVKESENEQNYGDKRKFGKINETKSNSLYFIACYIHNGGYHKDEKNSFIDYEALESCLTKINENYKNKKIASPIIGSYFSDGNGDKDKIIELFDKMCPDCNITLYDNTERDYSLEMFRQIAEVRQRLKDREINMSEYKKIRSDIEWRRTNGIFIEKPIDFTYQPKKEKSTLLYRGHKKNENI